MTPRQFFRDVCILLGLSLVAGFIGHMTASADMCAFPLLGLVMSIAMVCVFGRILFGLVVACLLMMAFVPRRFTWLYVTPAAASVIAGMALAFFMGRDVCASWPGLITAMLVTTCIALHMVGVLFWYVGHDTPEGGAP